MSDSPLLAQVIDEPLSVADHEAAVADKAAGAVVSFCGVVRDHDGGRSVTELEYVGHPTAAGLIAEGRASRRPWNVHPRARDQLWLAHVTGARHLVPAFGASGDAPDLARALAPVWRPGRTCP